MELKDLKFKILENNTAKSFIERYHYSHTCPNIWMAFGEFFEGKMINCIVFNYCCGRNMASEVMEGGDNTNTIELVRMVSLEPKPKNLESFSISRCVDYIKKNYKNIKLIISYADNSMGHKGYCYQASGFTYYGQSRPTKHWFLCGKRIHERNLNNLYGTSSYDKLKQILGDNIQYKINDKTKSRYYRIIAQSKVERKHLLKKIKVKTLPFPKGDNERYDLDHYSEQNLLNSNGSQKVEKEYYEQMDLFDEFE